MAEALISLQKTKIKRTKEHAQGVAFTPVYSINSMWRKLGEDMQQRAPRGKEMGIIKV